jgi:hypothetical protein
LGVKILKFFDAAPGFVMETVRIRDGKNGPGIRDKHPESATLHIPVLGIRIRMFLGLQDPDPESLVRGTYLDPAPDSFLACKIEF